jgi:hypothetical protein
MELRAMGRYESLLVDRVLRAWEEVLAGSLPRMFVIIDEEDGAGEDSKLRVRLVGRWDLVLGTRDIPSFAGEWGRVLKGSAHDAAVE